MVADIVSPEELAAEIAKIFSCTRCGYCCHGETTVSLDLSDQRRMVEELQMERSEVADAFWRISKNVVQMKIVDGHCIFYQDGCTVHKGRPWRCAEWPLHPSILLDVSNYTAIAESCPGINTQITYDEFCHILRKILSNTEKIHC